MYCCISQADKRTLKKKKIDAVSCEEEGSGGDTDILTGSSSSENNDPLLIAESSDTEQGVYAAGDVINRPFRRFNEFYRHENKKKSLTYQWPCTSLI